MVLHKLLHTRTIRGFKNKKKICFRELHKKKQVDATKVKNKFNGYFCISECVFVIIIKKSLKKLATVES